MKTVEQLAERAFTSEKELKQIATKIARIAGGLRGIANDTHGFDAEESKTLSQVAAVLENIVARHKKAANLKKKELADVEAMQGKLAPLLAGTFGALTAPADRIAFIVGVQAYVPSDYLTWQPRQFTRYLADEFPRALRDLAYDLARRGKGTPSERAALAWAQFGERKTGLQTKHHGFIGMASIHAGQQQ